MGGEGGLHRLRPTLVLEQEVHSVGHESDFLESCGDGVPN